MNLQILMCIIAFVSTLIIALIVIPILKKYKIGQIVRKLGPESHLSKSGTPTMGGITMLVPISVILLVASFKYPVLILPLIVGLGFGLTGFIDDRKKLVEHSSDGISAKMKMLLLFLTTAIFIVLYLLVFKLDTELFIPFLTNPITLSVGLFIIFIAFILLGSSNAVNLTDGLDGLAAGIVAIVMTFFTIVAVKNGDNPMIILGASTVGSVLAFLVFNVKPAKVFMGDTGSLALGGIVAVTAIMMKMPLYLAIVLLVPVCETLSVAMQVMYFKITKGKRLFKMAPLHHHLELSGLSEGKVVVLFWSITFVLSVIAYFI
ncbi:MAG: phospho-N-acetylmuramoyl-pentapeptide-transferase [Clostridia bacterium]|nr:phospho-N-acetylmuramoyl-pentapeptide-transferase [Clostridia bacterium]